MSKKTITLQEVLGENLKKAIAEIETVENTYERVTLRLELVNTIHRLKGNQEVEVAEGREALDNTKKKSNNKKAQAVQEAVDKVVNEEVQPEITPEPAQEVAEEAPAEEAPAEEVAEPAVEETQEIDETPMIMDDGNGGEVDIRPYYNALAIFDPELEETKQYIAYYASLYDLSEIVDSYSQGITKDIYELLNDDNAAAFYEHLCACMQG